MCDPFNFHRISLAKSPELTNLILFRIRQREEIFQYFYINIKINIFYKFLNRSF
jgi:hypothetical protein